MRPPGAPFAETQRVFVALPLSAEAMKETESIQAHLASAANHQGIGLRFTPPSQFHVTLAFLGEIASSRLELVRAAVVAVASSNAAFRIHVTGLVVFPSARRARVVGLALEDRSGSLPDAVAALHTALRREGFALEERAFRPHITLARLRRPARFTPLPLDTPATEAQYVCDSLAIYQSELGMDGAHYRVLHSNELRRVGHR